MTALYMQGISISDIEALIKKAVKEVLSEQSLTEHKELPSETIYLSRKEVSQMLKVSLVSLNNWANSGQLIPFKAGAKRVLYKKEDVENFILKINSKPFKDGKN